MGGRGDHYIQSDGSLQHIVRDPLYKETLMFINSLYNQGFISHQNFTDGTVEQEAINNEGSFFISAGHLWRAIAPHAAHPDIHCIPHLEQPGVSFYSPFANLTGWAGFFVPTVNSNPEATARFLDYILSDEGQTLVHAGIENVHWQWDGPDGTWVNQIGEARNTFETEGWSGWADMLGVYRYHFTLHAAIDSAFAWGLAIGNPFLQNVYTLNSTGKDASAFEGIDPAPATLEAANLVSINDNIFNPFVAQIIMASSQAEAESLYDLMVAEMEAMGLAGIEAVRTANFIARNQ
jgi:putative aldouronate transport system substrate-binding protein